MSPEFESPISHSRFFPSNTLAYHAPSNGMFSEWKKRKYTAVILLRGFDVSQFDLRISELLHKLYFIFFFSFIY